MVWYPNLYTVRVSLSKDGQVIDTDTQRFGIRKLEWNARSGLLINGSPVKLRGGCVHESNGPLGAMSFRETEYRRIRILKESGYNAVRGAHDPRSKEFLNACDEIGMYCMEEFTDVWYQNVGTYGYSLYFMEEWEKDLTLMVEKCYNHPSVIMYSIGNEISESSSKKGAELGGRMADLCRKLDDSRPVTMGVNLMLNAMDANGIHIKIGKTAEVHKDDVVDPKSQDKGSAMSGSVAFNILFAVFKGLFVATNSPKTQDRCTREIYSHLDICGYNYGTNCYDLHMKNHPDRLIVATETRPGDTYKNWNYINKYPQMIGDFVWTSWDYLGECGIGIVDYGKNTGFYTKPYPVIIAGSGTHDITGFRDTNAYMQAIVWGVYQKPFIATRQPKYCKKRTHYGLYRQTDAINSWSYEGFEGQKTEAQIYSIGDSIELFLNGRSNGKQKLKKCLARYKLTYEPGLLLAVSYDEAGREIARDTLSSAGKETLITAVAERKTIESGGDDLAYINVTLTDAQGITKPIEKLIRVKIEGDGSLLAVGSGAPRTEERYTGDCFTTYNGRMQVIVRSTENPGSIRITLSSEGLNDQTLEIQSK
ncbi:MAG TPA: hypothetical protein DCM45_04150 [Clostridiales bacterium]|nr:hypothetical protein [Clostridiales bacterium]